MIGNEGRPALVKTVVVVGVNHKTAPIELRERVYVPSGQMESTVARVVASPVIDECIVLSTCNRTEYYLHATDLEAAGEVALVELADSGALPVAEVEPHIYRRAGGEAVLHLFRVAGGLDSLVIGEAEILGQVGTAYETGQDLPGAIGPVLHRLFQSALAVGGEVRANTKLGHGAASIPSAAVRLAIKVFGSLEGRSAMVLGTGDMGEATLQSLLSAGVEAAFVASRTRERAQQTVSRVGGRPLTMEGFWRSLPEVDVIVTSTAAPRAVVKAAQVEAARQHASSPLLILDIALPRDVEPSAGELPGVFLYNVDDLQNVVEATEAARAAEISGAELIVGEHADKFWHWYGTREAAPVIRGFRRHAEQIRHEETCRLLESLSSVDPEDRARIEEAMRRMLNKILHPSTIALRQAADDPRGVGYLDALRRLVDSHPDYEDEEAE